MTKRELLHMLELAEDLDEVIIYDGDDKVYTLSLYGHPELGEWWLKLEFNTTVEDL